MSREEYLKDLIGQRYPTIKEFAVTVQIPYTTLLGMLKNGISKAAVDNVIKVCQGLNITIEDLQKADKYTSAWEPFYISKYEQQLLTRYRQRPEMKPALEALLGLEKEC